MPIKKPFAAGLAGVSMLLATTAIAAVDPQALAKELQDDGYVEIEIEVGPTQVKVEAKKRGTKYEAVYDAETGDVITEEEKGWGGMVEEEVEIEQSSEDFTDDEDDDEDDDDEDDDENEDESDDDENEDESDDDENEDESDDDEDDDDEDDDSDEDDGDDDDGEGGDDGDDEGGDDDR